MVTGILGGKTGKTEDCLQRMSCFQLFGSTRVKGDEKNGQGSFVTVRVDVYTSTYLVNKLDNFFVNVKMWSLRYCQKILLRSVDLFF